MRQLLTCSLLCTLLAASCSYANQWQTVECEGKPHARHEAGFVSYADKLYLLGGRRIQPVDELDPVDLSWRALSKPPLEMHHFQPAIWKDRIVIAGAMTGGYPAEQPLTHIYFYFPDQDLWQRGPEIPESRRRGGAGVVIVDNKLYLVGGITNGHIGGFVNWLDVYDLGNDTWQVLPDAPHQRDHFQAALLGGKIYAAGGRRTSQATGQIFSLVVPEVDVFDIETESWSVLAAPLPTPRAGNTTVIIDEKVVVVGGESARPGTAHNEVEAYDPVAQKWEQWPALNRGRHGTGVALANGYFWTSSGSGSRGGSPELTSTERMQKNNN